MLIGHMEQMHEPNEGNYKLFCQVQRILSGVIARIIQPPHGPQEQQTSLAPQLWPWFDDESLEPWMIEPLER